ncbi:MAG TPA: hypothetical protein VNR65_08065, partial [Geobacterales bacterium]|nr:hypothetical protein [Geobacterales bacterium]
NPAGCSGGVRSNGEVAGRGKDRDATQQQRRCRADKAPIQLSARQAVHDRSPNVFRLSAPAPRRHHANQKSDR